MKLQIIENAIGCISLKVGDVDLIKTIPEILGYTLEHDAETGYPVLTVRILVDDGVEVELPEGVVTVVKENKK